MSTKIVVLDRIDPSQDHIERLQKLIIKKDDLRLFHDQPNPGDNWDEVLRRIGDSNIIITSWTDFPEHLLKRLPKIKMLSVVATSYAWIDVKTATDQKVIVTNVPGYAGIAVAELIFAHILILSRKMHLYYDRTKSGDFSRLKEPGQELMGKTIGIVGTGAIGANVARLANGFGMKVLAYTKHPSDERALSLGVKFVDFDNLLREADFIVPCLALNEQTKGLFDDAIFQKMKNGAIFICASRPEIYIDAALKKALETGKLGGAGLDETSKEFKNEGHLLKMPNVLVTPEIGFFTQEALVRMVDISIDNVVSYVSGTPKNVVNPASLY